MGIIAATHQDHRPAPGGCYLDRLYSVLHAPEKRGCGKDRIPLLATILSDAIYRGLTKDGRVVPGSTLSKAVVAAGLVHPQRNHSAALAELVNAQSRQPLAEHWGDGTTSSSDGQRFRSGGKAESTGSFLRDFLAVVTALRTVTPDR